MKHISLHIRKQGEKDLKDEIVFNLDNLEINQRIKEQEDFIKFIDGNS